MREWLIGNFAWIKQYAHETDAELLSNMLNDVPISAIELKKLCQSVLKDSERELGYKIFNLLNDLYANHIDYTFCTPHVLFLNVSKIHKKLRFQTFL